MVRFFYKARDASGILTEGYQEADSRDEAVNRLLREGFVPLEIQEESSQNVSRKKILGQSGRPRLDDLADFLCRFSDLISADIPMVRALQMVEKYMTRESLKNAIARILVKVQDGTALSKALAFESKIFPPYWPGLIQSGEISGKLKEVLARLSQLVEKERETKSRLISGAIYPMLILIVGLIIVFVLLTFIVPKLTEVFSEMGQELPLLTQLLLLISGILSNTWWVFLILFVALALWIKSLHTTVAGRLAFERFAFRIPFWGEFIKVDDMERLARTIAILLESGVETVSALECGTQTLQRETFKQEMVKIVNAVRQGVGMSKAFAAASIFSEDVVSMLSVGEESGRGFQGFSQWAEISDRRLERMTKTATSLIEPAMILFLGGIFGFIVMALLLPIFNMSIGVK